MGKNKLCFAGIVVGAAVACAQGPTAPPFSYEGANGPAHWGGLSPEYATCETGKQQSPVDIRNAETANLSPIRFHYTPAALRIINNGHTAQVNFPAGSFITVGAERYELKQFHFHRPSEERIDGKPFEMVIHLVHANARGDLAVVSVLVETGQSNATLAKIFDEIPKTIGKAQDRGGIQIDASALLPSGREYYTYRGSLTTPPCTEGVTWFILKSPVTASGEEIKMFSALFAPNARPIQPLDGRTVRRSN